MSGDPITLERLRPLREGVTDKSLLGHYRMPGDDFIYTDDTYSWYYAIGANRRPLSMLELGVRYGYAAVAVAKGTLSPHFSYIGIDNQHDGIDSNHIALSHMAELAPYRVILPLDTKDTVAVHVALAEQPIERYDIVHVDGDHSQEGIIAELHIAQNWVKPDGIILVDDCDTRHIDIATRLVAAQYGIQPVILPTIHSLAVIDLQGRTDQ